VEQTSDQSPTSNHRVIWCPYIPDEDNSDAAYEDVAKLLVLTHGAKVNNCFVFCTAEIVLSAQIF
jgi:hypothetical protein